MKLPFPSKVSQHPVEFAGGSFGNVIDNTCMQEERRSYLSISLRSLRLDWSWQENYEFKVSIGYIAQHCLKYFCFGWAGLQMSGRTAAWCEGVRIQSLALGQGIFFSRHLEVSEGSSSSYCDSSAN